MRLLPVPITSHAPPSHEPIVVARSSEVGVEHPTTPRGSVRSNWYTATADHGMSPIQGRGA